MIESKLDSLRRERSFRLNRDITMKEIASATGLSLAAIQRMRAKNPDVRLSTVVAICKFFEVKSIVDLIEYIPDASEQS